MQSAELGRRCLDTFTQLIPASGSVFYRIAAQLEPHDFLLQQMRSDMHERYLSYYRRLDPLQPSTCQLTGCSVVPLRLGMRAQNDTANQRYGDFLQGFGVVDVVEVLAFEQGLPIAGISLLRGRDLGLFGAHELVQLQALQGMFEIAVKQLSPSAPAQQLTPREWEVAELLRAGLGNKAIARQLGVGLPTVKTHLINLFRKVAVSNRTELVATLFL
ncbi:MAG TPA: helix-turn-helix transcriptional regulator [Pseudomonas sp.]|nr:helix-turn-helix transcriptional regulator [Pseudomonas sp.]